MTKETIEYLVLVIATLVIVSIISFTIRRFLGLIIDRNSKLLRANSTNFIFIKNSISFVLYSVAIIWIFLKIPYFKSLGTTLFAGAGILAAIIGFASQKAFSNIIGGIFILIFKPFRVGDIVEISNNRSGFVEEITLRHTVIRNFEWRRIVIPNSIISDETILNSTISDERIRKHIEVSISYDSDIELAKKIISETIEKHPNCRDYRKEEDIKNGDEKVPVLFISMTDFSINLKAYAWAEESIAAFMMQCDCLQEIKEKFDEVGIEIPFPYRTIVYKKDLEEAKKLGLQ